LGQSLAEQGKLKEAIANFQKALESNHPKPFAVYKALGDALTEINKPQQAISAYKQAMVINPNHPAIKKSLQKLIEQD